MKLSQLVSPKGIKPVLVAEDRDTAIAEMVGVLVSSGAADAKLREELVRLVMERERRGSTGFGRGVAVPHVKHASVRTTSAAIGLSPRGIDFSALDKQPVYSVFLLLSPEDRPDEHLHAMEVIFKNLGNERFRRLLRQSGSPEEIHKLLEEADLHPHGV